MSGSTRKLTDINRRISRWETRHHDRDTVSTYCVGVVEGCEAVACSSPVPSGESVPSSSHGVGTSVVVGSSAATVDHAPAAPDTGAESGPLGLGGTTAIGVPVVKAALTTFTLPRPWSRRAGGLIVVRACRPPLGGALECYRNRRATSSLTSIQPAHDPAGVRFPQPAVNTAARSIQPRSGSLHAVALYGEPSQTDNPERRDLRVEGERRTEIAVVCVRPEGTDPAPSRSARTPILDLERADSRSTCTHQRRRRTGHVNDSRTFQHPEPPGCQA